MFSHSYCSLFVKNQEKFFWGVNVTLQVQDPVTNFLGAALVPELGADVAAGTAGHIHFALVGVAAFGASPD